MNILCTGAQAQNSAVLEREKGVPGGPIQYAFGKDRRVEHIDAELNRCSFEATITQV